jgi:hypothetical protein
MSQGKLINANFTANPRFSLEPCRGGVRADGFQLTLAGKIGARYEIDTATSLGNWAPIATVTNSFGTSQFTDLSATNGLQRFCRVHLAP